MAMTNSKAYIVTTEANGARREVTVIASNKKSAGSKATLQRQREAKDFTLRVRVVSCVWRDK